MFRVFFVLMVIGISISEECKTVLHRDIVGVKLLTREDSPVCVNKSINIPPHQTLEIGPGVEVKICRECSIVIKGCFKAIGTKDEVITIMRMSDISRCGHDLGTFKYNSNNVTQLEVVFQRGQCENNRTYPTGMCMVGCTDRNLCSGHGRCVCGSCDCDLYYTGRDCRYKDDDFTLECGKYNSKDRRVCNGHGKCIYTGRRFTHQGECHCDEGYIGTYCYPHDEDHHTTGNIDYTNPASSSSSIATIIIVVVCCIGLCLISILVSFGIYYGRKYYMKRKAGGGEEDEGEAIISDRSDTGRRRRRSRSPRRGKNKKSGKKSRRGKKGKSYYRDSGGDEDMEFDDEEYDFDDYVDDDDEDSETRDIELEEATRLASQLSLSDDSAGGASD